MEERQIAFSADLLRQGLSFDPVLLPPDVPAPLSGDGEGRYFLQLPAPEAGRLELQTEAGTRPFQRGADGVWRVELPYQRGFHYIHIRIDGVEMLWPYLPVSFGYSRLCNYIALPEEDGGFYSLRDVPHGKLIRECFYSSVAGEWKSCLIYTPPGYEQADRTLPVLYLQHGHGENETSWATAGRVHCILDNLIAQGRCVPFAVVMNSGMVQTVRHGERAADFALMERLLPEDVIPFVEERYHVGGCRERRAMAGLSMGSLQTSITGFLHPELFSALGVFSGFLHDWIRGSEIDMIPRGPGDDRHLAILQDREGFDRAFEVFFRAIGEDDPFLAYFQRDDALCREAGIRQERRVYPGTHDWNVWRRCLRDFAVLLFRGQDTL